MSHRSEEHTSELQSLRHLVCRLLLEKRHIPARAYELRGWSRDWLFGEAAACGARRRMRVGHRAEAFKAFSFFNDTATTEIYTLSLHDALPISRRHSRPLSADRYERPRHAHQRTQ